MEESAALAREDAGHLAADRAAAEAAGRAPFYGDCRLCAAAHRGFTFSLWFGDSEEEVRGLVQAHISQEHGADFTRVWRNPQAPEPAPFAYEEYRAKALEIHAATCNGPGWCNYGEPEPPELADDVALPWPERQRRAGERLGRMNHCMAAVAAENRAGDALREDQA